MSCDVPFLSADALRWLLAQAKPGALAVLPHLDAPEMPEPLIALYTPLARRLLEAEACAGERSIRRILAGKIHSPRVPEELGKAFTNVNTPEEWRAALAEIEKAGAAGRPGSP